MSLQVRGVGVVAQGRPRGAARARRFRLLRQHAALHAQFRRRIRAARAAHAARSDGAADRPHRIMDGAAGRGDDAVGSLVLPFISRAASIIGDVAPATANRLTETCLSLVTSALGERFGDVSAGGSAGARRADLAREGDHRPSFARSRAQHRKGRRAFAGFAALRAGSFSRRRRDRQRLDLEAAARQEPA